MLPTRFLQRTESILVEMEEVREDAGFELFDKNGNVLKGNCHKEVIWHQAILIGLNSETLSFM